VQKYCLSSNCAAIVLSGVCLFARIQVVLAVLVIFTVLLVCVSPVTDMPFTVLRTQQAALLLILTITLVAQRTLLRRSSDPVLQGIFDATSSLVPLSSSSTLACALLC
jgi:hypothetical protein